MFNITSREQVIVNHGTAEMKKGIFFHDELLSANKGINFHALLCKHRYER